MLPPSQELQNHSVARESERLLGVGLAPALVMANTCLIPIGPFGVGEDENQGDPSVQAMYEGTGSRHPVREIPVASEGRAHHKKLETELTDTGIGNSLDNPDGRPGCIAYLGPIYSAVPSMDQSEKIGALSTTGPERVDRVTLPHPVKAVPGGAKLAFALG
ncbi:hypothetical protein JB92DRAFT_2825895 [Gautieria morchelliformis]|nr:hypothetical protein JB92DRAFT_2825895 [Gautieria morchelliformis]